MLEEAPPPVAQDTTKRSSLGVLPAWTLLAVACCGLVAAAAATPLGPPHPAMLPGNFARNIRNLECVSRKTQEKGTCMFALSCLKLNGTHLGVCVDRFYYGSCCRLPDLDQEVDIGGGDSNDISAGGLLKPVTAASVAEIDASPSTARPQTTLVTKPPVKVTTTTTGKPPKPIVTAAPTKKPITPAPFTAATTKKPVVTSAKPATSSTTKPQTKPTAAPTTPSKKPPVAATTAKPVVLATNATTTTSKPQKPTTATKPVTKPPTSVTKPPSPVTKPPVLVTKPPVLLTRPPVAVTKPPSPVTKPPTLATKPPVTATKPTQKPTAAATKPTQKPVITTKPTPKPSPVTSKPVITTSTTVSNEVSSKPVTSATSKPIIEAIEEETNALSEGQKPSTTRPTPPTFPGANISAKPSPPTFPSSSVSTSRPTPPTFPNTSAKPVESSSKPATSVTTGKPQNSTDENWVQIELSTTSPAPAKPTPTYPDGNLFTEEIPAGVSRPTPPTFSPVSQTTTTESALIMEPPLNMTDYKQVCGRRLLPDGRIVGGTRSTFAKWPWQISLRQWRTSTYLHKCGAALLNENWAITAAHCVENVPPSDLLLRLGEHDLSTESEAHPHLERRVQIVASHPQFDSRTFEYDLALLRFYEPVVFQPNVIPICIPQDDKNYVGENAYVTGWGRLYEDGPLPSVMQEVSVPVLENAVCETMYRSAGYIEHIPNIFICAGWKKGGFDSCEGDSGGPMVIQRDDKRWTLAGVISWGIGCAEPNQPGVYTRISAFKDWINQILQF